MILLTGGTGFVGRALARQLFNAGHPVRILLRPSQRTPDLPRGVPVEVAVSSLTDERGLRGALRGVDTIYHLAGAEQEGVRADLLNADIKGTETLVRAASGAKVKRLFFCKPPRRGPGLGLSCAEGEGHRGGVHQAW